MNQLKTEVTGVFPFLQKLPELYSQLRCFYVGTPGYINQHSNGTRRQLPGHELDEACWIWHYRYGWLAMINNKVHWASDYPLAIALRYLCAKEVVKNNRKIASKDSKNKYKAKLSCSFNYEGGRFMPEMIYDF